MPTITQTYTLKEGASVDVVFANEEVESYSYTAQSADGTAIQGEDYPGYTLSGAGTGDFSMPIGALNDDIYEGRTPEIFTIIADATLTFLSDGIPPTPYSVDYDGVFTFRIDDEDDIPKLSVQASYIKESNSSSSPVTITVQADHAASFAYSITVNIVGGASYFDASTFEVTMPAFHKSASRIVNVFPDGFAKMFSIIAASEYSTASGTIVPAPVYLGAPDPAGAMFDPALTASLTTGGVVTSLSFGPESGINTGVGVETALVGAGIAFTTNARSSAPSLSFDVLGVGGSIATDGTITIGIGASFPPTPVGISVPVEVKRPVPRPEPSLLKPLSVGNYESISNFKGVTLISTDANVTFKVRDTASGLVFKTPFEAIITGTDKGNTFKALEANRPYYINAGSGHDSIAGGNSSDGLVGGLGNDILSGRIGNDQLAGGRGSDNLSGGAGNDILLGGAGRDKLAGGAGRDRFVFDDRETGTSKNTADYILDFKGNLGDKLDLKLVDANSRTRSDQKFKFVGEENSFTKVGQIRFEHFKNDTWIFFNTDSDATAEGAIRLNGVLDVKQAWFVL